MMKTRHDRKKTTVKVKGMRCAKCGCPAFVVKTGTLVACVQCGKTEDIWGAC